MPDDRLESWKEIAAYLRRGVRTVRRWEHDEGLPVHRHLHRVLGSVYAYRSEIDAWRRSHERDRAAPIAATPSRAKSIAVLPFTNLSADRENEYFADGLADEITARLSTIAALRVTSRTSSSVFKATMKDARTIAHALGVQYLLEGSVRRDRARLRITAQLIDARSDDHLWAETYDGMVDDVFAFQERLARTIAGALEVRLSADEDRRLARRPIANLHAYECYLRARQQGWRWRKDAIDHAVQLLRNGLAVVGDNAELYAALGLACLQYREAGIDLGDRPLHDADACARKVFALEPASAAGRQLRGWIHYARGRIRGAVDDLKTALLGDPQNADTLLLLSNCYLISGKVAAARPLIDRLLAIDPLTPVTRCMPAWADILEGRFAAAVDPYRQMLEMDPANPMARLFYAWVLLLNRRTDEAHAIVDAASSDVQRSVPGRIARFLMRAHTGRTRDLSAGVAGEVEGAAATSDVFARILAQGYAAAGDRERSMRWLATAVDRGFINHPFLARHDPFLAGLRTHPPFVRLMQVVRRRWERFEA